MDSPSLTRSNSNNALHPVSPDRINQQTMPNSLSVPSELLHLRKYSRGVSDVQAKVAFLNNLSRGHSPGAAPPPPSSLSSSSSSSAALQRAILGREEAECALANVSAQLLEAQSRERVMSERLEALLEELHNAKARQEHERAIFEKEIRKARKEAFRAGSALVKLQEDLKDSRSEMKSLKEELKSEKISKEKAKQDAFERAYALAGLTEELEEVKGRLRSAETRNNSNSLNTSAEESRKEESGSNATSDGTKQHRQKRSAEDSLDEMDSEVPDYPALEDTPPKRPRLSEQPQADDGVQSLAKETESDVLGELRRNLNLERQLRVDAEEMIDFLKMECQFKMCSCRVAETRGVRYIHDDKWIRTKVKASEIQGEDGMMQPSASDSHKTIESSEIQTNQVHNSLSAHESQSRTEDAEQQLEEPVLTFSPTTGTFRTISSPIRFSTGKRMPDEAAPSDICTPHAEEPTHEYDQELSPSARYGTVVRRYKQKTSDRQNLFADNSITTTTTVTFRPEENRALDSFSNIPGTPVTREEALAQIRERRDRSQTMNRSASASEAVLRSGGMGVTPIRNTKRIPCVQGAFDNVHSEKGPRRDLSAPVRMPR